MENGFNDNVQSWVVQKFGGTSLGKFAVDIVEMIIKCDIGSHAVLTLKLTTGRRIEQP